MRHIKKYTQFNEGFKENILVGLLSLFGVATSAQSKFSQHRDKEGTTHQEYTTTSQNQVDKYLKSGWSLTSQQVDTVWNKLKDSKANAEVEVVRLNINKNELFKSGSFQINDDIKQDIDSVLNYIVDSNGLLSKIEIESSTDKQQLTASLQKTLKSMGLEANNIGLSKARSSSVEQYLQSKSVNDTLININNLVEQGSGEVEDAARYVTIDFYYIIPSEPPASGTPNYNVKTTYHLNRDLKSPEGTYKFKGANHETKKMGPLKHQKGSLKNLKCYFK